MSVAGSPSRPSAGAAARRSIGGAAAGGTGGRGPASGRMIRLELDNFKSYHGRHTVPFTQFTAVIGPNGSGKSNLLDAFSFVLGVTTAKTMRGENLKDLIHKKPDEDPTAIDDEKRTAYVEMVYMDSSDTAISFRRSISHTGVSTYSLDGKRMSLDSYTAQLEDIGISSEAKNFLVMQGDIEMFGQKDAKAMTKHFEKLSGSGALKAAYDEAKAELESREAEMTAGFEEKRLISREKNQMKQQKEEAEEYNTTLEDYKATKRNYCLFQLFRLQVDIDAKQAAARGVAKDLRARTSALDVLRASVADLSSSTAKLRKETQVSEKKLQKSTAELDKKRPQQIKVKQELVHASKSIEKERQLLQLAQQEATDHADKVKLLEKDLKKAQRLYAELEAALEAEDEKSKELKLAADQAKEYNELKAKSAVETAEAHGALKQAEHDQRVAQERFDAIRVLMANIQERVDALRESTDELKKKAAKNVDAAKQAKADLADMKKKLAEMRAKAAQATKRKGELDVELFSVQEKLTDAASDRREREGDLKLRDTIDTLRAHFPSVRGSLSELCDVTHPKYSTAMAVVFGRHIDSVVVADQKTALECINYLKEQRLGMLTFIPLDTIKVKPISEANRQMRERGFPLAIDCINFDEEIEKAYIYALSDTLICDSERDEAGAIKKASDQAAGHKHKIVTLGGTVIHKSGNMTGGTSTRADSKGGKLKSAAEKSASKALINEKEYQKLVKRRDELVEELLRLEEEGKQAHRQQDEEAKLAGKIVSLESRLKYIEIDVEASTKKVADNEKKIKAMETEIEKNQPIASEIEEKVKEKSDVVAATTADLAKREEKIFRDFSRRVGLANIREFENERLKLADQYHAEKVRLTTEVTHLKNALDYERNRDLEKAITTARQRIKELEAKMKHAHEMEAKVAAELEKEKAKVDEQLEESKRIAKEMDKKQQELKEAKKKSSDLETEVVHLDKQINSIRSTILTDQMRRHEVLRQAKVDDVDLPLIKDAEKASPKKKKQRREEKKGEDEEEEGEEEEEEEKGDEDVEMSGSDATASESKELAAESRLRFDYDELDESFLDPQSSASEIEDMRQQFTSVIAEHSSKLEQLAPNLKAIEKFAGVADKFNNTKTEWEKKKQAVKTASDAFAHIKEARLQKFMQAYTMISAAVEHVYVQLTSSRELPTGGKAYLSLESTDEPYLHGIKYAVMPPMKRFRPLSELSGGEKTVAALALLFAIHSYKPAPFFVLDEIDAALDNINVNRVSAYIRTRCARDKLQVVVISLKDTFYNKANALVGVYKDQDKQSSAHITIDLTKYDS